MTFTKIAASSGRLLRGGVPRQWDGRKAILEMQREGSRHWKQMEWIGFYFEFLCQRALADLLEFPGPRYGRVQFDALYHFPWDIKAHAMNTSSHQIIVNDSEATALAIREYGRVGLILALGPVGYNDEERAFQRWHEDLKGGKSEYERKRIQRGAWSRLRKVRFDLQQIALIQLTDAELVRCGSFQSDFRNSNGRPRRGKVLVDLEKLSETQVHFVDFRR